MGPFLVPLCRGQNLIKDRKLDRRHRKRMIAVVVEILVRKFLMEVVGTEMMGTMMIILQEVMVKRRETREVFGAVG